MGYTLCIRCFLTLCREYDTFDTIYRVYETLLAPGDINCGVEIHGNEPCPAVKGKTGKQCILQPPCVQIAAHCINVPFVLRQCRKLKTNLGKKQRITPSQYLMCNVRHATRSQALNVELRSAQRRPSSRRASPFRIPRGRARMVVTVNV